MVIWIIHPIVYIDLVSEKSFSSKIRCFNQFKRCVHFLYIQVLWDIFSICNSGSYAFGERCSQYRPFEIGGPIDNPSGIAISCCAGQSLKMNHYKTRLVIFLVNLRPIFIEIWMVMPPSLLSLLFIAHIPTLCQLVMPPLIILRFFFEKCA